MAISCLCCIHFMFMLHIFYVYVVYILCLCCIHFKFTLHTFYVYVAYILFLCCIHFFLRCIHFMFTLHAFYVYVAYILCLSCINFMFILHTFYKDAKKIHDKFPSVNPFSWLTLKFGTSQTRKKSDIHQTPRTCSGKFLVNK
jgi:hypothetical protein